MIQNLLWHFVAPRVEQPDFEHPLGLHGIAIALRLSRLLLAGDQQQQVFAGAVTRLVYQCNGLVTGTDLLSLHKFKKRSVSLICRINILFVSIQPPSAKIWFSNLPSIGRHGWRLRW